MVSDDFLGPEGHFEIWARLLPGPRQFEDPRTASHRIPRARLSKAYFTLMFLELSDNKKFVLDFSGGQSGPMMDMSGDDISVPLVWDSTRTPPASPSKPSDNDKPATYLPLLEEIVYDLKGNEVQIGKRGKREVPLFIEVVEDVQTIWKNIPVRSVYREIL